ncbi:MAG: T9SS type A sorting domain-containing protein [Bacteroidetes bacterium]|nr:T9SS type A sorting domain-containing protein [Bacteroidota bacterium]
MESNSKSMEGKLAMYSAVALGVLAASQAQAQVYHTDINPDKTITANDSFLLDLNNDGMMDFNLKAAQINTTSTTYGLNIVANIDYVGIEPMNGNEILLQSSYISSSNYLSVVGLLNQNDEIKDVSGGSSFWSDSYNIMNAKGLVKIMMGSVTYASYPIDMGLFDGVVDKFIGLRLKQVENGDTLSRYGWIRVDVAADAKSFVVKDYGMEGTPDKSVFAGVTSSDLEENALATSTKIFVRNRNLIIKQSAIKTEEFDVRVVDMNGREVTSKKISAAYESLDLSQEAKGIYIVQIMANSTSFQKKVILK